MNTLKRRAIFNQWRLLPADAVQQRKQARSLQVCLIRRGANPACVIGPGQRCEHSARTTPTADRQLFVYEQGVRALCFGRARSSRSPRCSTGRLCRLPRSVSPSIGWTTLPEAFAGSRLGRRAGHAGAACALPVQRRATMRQARADRADVVAPTPAAAARADRRLRLSYRGHHPMRRRSAAGVVPYVFRMAQSPQCVWVKAYAGAMFDIETDMADWAQRAKSSACPARSTTCRSSAAA